MAERRMFTRKITDDDRFMNLSSSAQALYLHLSMNADDDGFCNQVSVQMFRAHASVQDLEALLSARFIYQFESGVIVIKHWRMANALRKDRYNETTFKQELSMLSLDENGAYTMHDGCQMVADWLPDGCQMVASCLPQDRIGKDSIGKVSIDNTDSRESDPVSVPKKKGIFQEFAAGDKALLDALREYNEYRNKKKKPLTDGAKTRLCKRLVSMFGDDHAEMISAIYYAIDKGWMDIYKPKEQAQPQQKATTESVTESHDIENLKRYLESLRN